MMNNPMQMIQQLQRSTNPQQMLMQMAQRNPSIQRAMQIANGRTPQQLLDMANHMAQQSGQNLAQLAQQIGVRLPG